MHILERQAMAKAIKKLEELPNDAELAHSMAEDVLCDFLKYVGFGDLSEAFEVVRDDIGFWYA
tara:strand:+ start:1257 stop:1445 length:189 start_codon:yes stop_codon:yes gene_type:complete